MEIQHEQKERGGNFFILHKGKKTAILDYTITSGGRMDINHTMVAKEFEGQGIARKLVLAAIEFARKNKMKIKPYCPYAAAFMKKNAEEFADVLG